MGAPRREARNRSKGSVRGIIAFVVLLGGVIALALGATGIAAAAPSTGCTAGPTVGTETTWECNISTGTIGGYEVRQWTPSAFTPPQTGYITHMETDVVDATTGAQVPISRLMLHHIVFLNVLKQDNTCAGKGFTGFDGRESFGSYAPQRFFAAGEERMKMSLPSGYGYPTSSSDVWGVVAMVMNHRAAADHALINYKVTIDTNPSITPVKPYWFDVRDCHADPIYNVPSVPAAPKKAKKKSRKGAPKKASAAGKHKGKKKKKHKKKVGPTPVTNETRDYVIPESGRFVAGAGHVHGGAVGLKLTEPNCGDREVARSDPTWGNTDHPFYNVRPVLHEPGPINMSAFRSTTGLPVHAGETIRLNSIYDDSLPHVRVMGIMIAYLAPDPTVTQNCGPVPNWEVLKTNEPGRSGPFPTRSRSPDWTPPGRRSRSTRPPDRSATGRPRPRSRSAIASSATPTSGSDRDRRSPGSSTGASSTT